MATLIRRIVQGYRYINGELSDPRTQDYLFIGSPWEVLGITAIYLYFVFEFGPSMMAKRKPFKLDRIIQMYNLLQIVACGYLLYKALSLGWLFEYSFVCEPVDFSYSPRAIEVTGIVWMYFLVKILDLMDTVFFVLRKKQNQVSFLHVYHHVGMVYGSWVTTKFLPGGHITFIGAVNSFVHVIMYTYYLATSLNMSKPWWKKHITQLQIFQFLLLLVQFVQLVLTKDCGFPKWVAAVFIPQNLFMLVLFGDFYYKAYIKQSRTKPVQNGVSSEVTNGKPKSQ